MQLICDCTTNVLLPLLLVAMFEGVVYQVLAGYLGHYFKDLQKEQLRVGLWSGKPRDKLYFFLVLCHVYFVLHCF